MRDLVLNKLHRTIGYRFKNDELINQALTHRSFERENNNERLEFLGDSVLGFVITEELFKRYPKCSEGELTRIRASLVRGETLAELGLAMGLGDAMHLGLGELNTGGFRRHSTIEDALEALIGAIYLDSDFLTVKSLVLQWFVDLFARVNVENIPRDYKSQLQEALQARGLMLPSYEILREEGPDHNKIFFVRCIVASLNEHAEGQGSSRKLAEQEAAKKTLALIQS